MSFDPFFTYQALHRHPELSDQEEHTCEYLLTALSSFGYHPKRVGLHGVMADLITDPAKPYLLLRSDMDALPITEKTGAPYTSEHPGIMHACGHDAHMTMLLGAAERLQSLVNTGAILPQNIRFLFQPAEEITDGARQVLADGAIPAGTLAAFAFHVWPEVPFGTLATHVPDLMASSDEFLITIHGVSAHCAKKEQGKDALQTALGIAARLPELTANGHDPRTLLFLGSLHAGTSHNVVADTAVLHGTLRTFSMEDREHIRQAIQSITQEITQKKDTTYDVLWRGCPPVNNDAKLVYKLQNLSQAGRLPVLSTKAIPSLAGEDFSEYQQRIPGVLLWLGLGDSVPLHNDHFLVPETLLPIGIDAWETIATTDWASVGGVLG